MTTIRVVATELRRAALDITTASADELDRVLEDPKYADCAAGFRDLARFAAGPVGAFAAPEEGALPAVLARTAMQNPAARPRLLARGADAVADAPPGPGRVRTRPARRVRAVGLLHNEVAPLHYEDLAAAAEEPIEIADRFVVSPAEFGAVVTRALGGAPLPGGDDAVASGAYVPAALAAAWPDRPAEGSAGASAVEIILASAAALNYYFSNAATRAVAARVGAALAREPGAPAQYMAAFERGEALGDFVVERADLVVTDAAEPAEPPATFRDPAAAKRLRYLLERLAATEFVAPDSTFDANGLADLFRTGAAHIWLAALVLGRESVQLDEFFERLAIRHAKRAQMAALAAAAAQTTADARQYVLTIERKFGPARAREVVSALRSAAGSRSRGAPGGRAADPLETVQISNAAAVLAQLKPREREVVLTDYEIRKREWAAAAANRCPHRAAQRALRTATTAAAASAALANLARFFAAAPAKAASWLTCRLCGEHALCPHVRDRVALEARRAPHDEIRSRLAKYGSMFCRTCAEQLADDAPVDDEPKRSRYGGLDAHVRTRVWTLALAAARHVRFPAPTDERQFAGAATDVAFPLLETATRAAGKRRVRRRKDDDEEETEEVDPLTTLRAVLLVYAYVLDLVRISRGQRGREVGFAGVKLDAREGVYAAAMLERIAADHRGLLSQIEDLSAEYIRAQFAESYRAVRGESLGAVQAASPEEEIAVYLTSIDPIYRYALSAAVVAGDLPAARPETAAAARHEFEAILGRGLPEIVRRGRDNARDPRLAALYQRRTGAEVPPGTTLDWAMRQADVNLYADMYAPRLRADTGSVPAGPKTEHWVGGDGAWVVDADFVWVVDGESVAGGKAPKPKPNPRPKDEPRPKSRQAEAAPSLYLEAYALFVQYTRDVRSQSDYEAYLKRLAAQRARESRRRLADAGRSIKTYDNRDVTTSQRFVPVPVGISSVFDVQGRRHSWATETATYYYGALELKGIKALKAARESGELPPGEPLTDVGCATCGERASALPALNAAAVWASMRTAAEINSFYVFYQTQCPEGGLHDWADRQCAKCGLTSEITKDVANGRATSSAASRAYYERYATRFGRDRTAARAVTPKRRLEPTPPVNTERVWRPDYTVVVEAAKLVGATPATVEAIGSTEGRDYADIVAGVGAPPAPTRASDPRIYAAHAEVRFFLSEYNTLRFGAAGKSGELPDVGADYRSAPPPAAPAESLEFAIQSLCRMVLALAATSAKQFAVDTFAQILRGQKLLSKPGKFNYAIFSQGEDLDDLGDDPAGDVGEDVMAEDLVAEEESPDGDRDDSPFSGEAMDYDTSENEPNNEPA
jgi:hypothetical protein